MKRLVLIILLLALFALLAFPGCSTSKTKNGDGSNGENGQKTDYDKGLSQGYEDGYEQGYADGSEGTYNPDPETTPEGNEEYIAGYEEGFGNGYQKGYAEAQATIEDGQKKEEEELAEVEAAMIAYAKANSAPGLELEIENIVIHDDEAAGIVICTNERLESPLVIVKKGTSGWYGVDFGTGIEPPSWYTY